ncbi:uncharacterized protein YbbK (DUF523 family) [Cytobacillus firmus]|uniref:Uncharacterized protein YbbK (DUF523 family) n=2 Tax=Cytobacillus TaxID=2675230 RepID=A0A366JPH1_CYTFI|nr:MULTISPECIES: DUF523 domain-containing protein [Cytobacillus]RBP89990.1 uncharacterized protein YbbK (DUF523 family) [Cytobacillus firmus]TDX40438.1 uncharacterized protein YbbK (DUF523 family) [Cytobacillus oceanisediminis]
MILVSSCLAGLEVRYNGTHCLNQKIRQMLDQQQAITVCPELLGGFSTPREPAEIIDGDGAAVLDGKAKVIEKSGRDVTDLYIEGAYITLRKAQELQVTAVVLKEYSPSCGSSMIYNGEFKGNKIPGDGVTSALLKRNGINVVSEEGLADLLLEEGSNYTD